MFRYLKWAEQNGYIYLGKESIQTEEITFSYLTLNISNFFFKLTTEEIYTDQRNLFQIQVRHTGQTQKWKETEIYHFNKYLARS